MRIEIKHKDGRALHTVEADSLRSALISLVASGANLRNADLTGANLRNADLGGVDLRGANLRGVDLGTVDLRDVPVVKKLHQSILAAIGAGGRLERLDWHMRATTHCRSGWAIHLAGKPGYALQERVGPLMAGALIHFASCKWMDRVPNFSASNEEALADIRKCAEREKSEVE